MHLEDIVNNYLNPEEFERFAEWAFGSDYIRLRNAREFLTQWRELHADLYYLSWHSSINEDIKVMIELWRKSDH